MAPRESTRASNGGNQQPPPVQSRFRPGQSGNPGGRPKKDRDFSRLINGELDAVVEVVENGKKVKLTKRELVAKSLVNDAAKGNLRAIDALARYGGLGSGTQDKLIEVDPQVIATFVARFYPPAAGEQE